MSSLPRSAPYKCTGTLAAYACMYTSVTKGKFTDRAVTRSFSVITPIVFVPQSSHSDYIGGIQYPF